ncbi:MAG: helicase-exonuclease AddAB subunit AddA [Tyzzerella sp.]|nr:helicase-exonuclease AddAB subunit AddA [Tyzzerella sp.]
MGVVFTKEQQQVIDLRNRNILVSAAAGSGKTAVLVERIITRLTKDAKPLNVDELLIVTFTEAAASEMKERIHGAIENALENEPDNVHLQRQATLIHQAQITTIHKFCLSVIRDYFHTIDLDPGFRVGEEGELKLLKRDVVEAVLETAYEKGDDGFIRFVESYATGRDDRKLEELILQLYELSRSYPNPKKWLDSCVEQYHVQNVEELEQKPFVLEMMQEVKQYLSDIQKLLEFGITVCDEEDGPAVYRDALNSDWMLMTQLQRADSFEKMQKELQSVNWAKLAACRDKMVSEKKIQQVKDIRDEVKGLVKDLSKQYFFDDVYEIQEEMAQSEQNMRTLTELVKAFAEAFSEEKRRKNLIDFNDMEQYALQILTREEEGKYVPSIVAESYQEKFAEIMIDEYQDSNLVQEAILTSVSTVSKGIYNIFMVGDVKQSIYRFRLSRPELFMEKFHNYSLEDSKTQRIDLHKNFRSRREVLDSTNFVFEQIMISEFGGIAYDEKAALYVGADYEERVDNETEVLILEAPETKTEERIELEAEMVAKRIKELMATHIVYDKETKSYRKVRYNDIVILTRSLKGWTDTFSTVLNSAGIPTYTGSKEGYFQTHEIELALQYLKILDNPRQDIPMAAVLLSMFGGLTSEELAIIRSSTREKTLYESIRAYREHGEQVKIREHLDTFLNIYERFREQVPYKEIHRLLWELMDETGYMDYVSALPSGEQRAANLEMLLEKAVTFEGTSYKGLFHFVRYIEQLEKYDVDYGEASLMDEKMNVVNLMSIHKSKGLEFPIVFVVGMGKQFNMQDTKQSIVVHPELGVGVDAVDTVLRVKTSTLLKKAIQHKVQIESKAEELRVLYVAMTRAKEKLILCGATVDMEKELFSLASIITRAERKLSYYSLTKANKYMDWVLLALVRNKCFAHILEQYDMVVPYGLSMHAEDVPLQVKIVTVDELILQEAEEQITDGVTKHALEHWDTRCIYDEEMKQQFEEQFAYQYSYDDSCTMKQKLSVSELKKRAYMEQDGTEVFKEEEVIPLLPKFLEESEQLTGASRGSAYHKFLELLDYTKEYDATSLAIVLAKNVQEGLLTTEMADCIHVQDILTFLGSTVARRMRQAALQGKLFLEQPFVLGMEARELYSETESDECILVQGIIDVYFEEEDSLILLDYKTDRVSEAQELVDKYCAQLEYYARALHQLTGKQVKEKVIYSFALEKEIEVY